MDLTVPNVMFKSDNTCFLKYISNNLSALTFPQSKRTTKSKVILRKRPEVRLKSHET